MSWLYIAGMPILAGLSAATTGGAVAVAQTEVPAAPVTATAAEDAVQTLALRADAYRRMTVPVTVNGQGPYHFMVDTGATMVIVRESDAARVGVRPMRADYTATVSTANGKIKAAPAKLDRLEVGGITVYDVQALVLPDDALWQNLLGMSFLSRLKRYEVANGQMVLEQ